MFKKGDKVICNKSYFSNVCPNDNIIKGKVYTILDLDYYYCNLVEIGDGIEYNNSRFDSLKNIRIKKIRQLEQCSK